MNVKGKVIFLMTLIFFPLILYNTAGMLDAELYS